MPKFSIGQRVVWKKEKGGDPSKFYTVEYCDGDLVHLREISPHFGWSEWFLDEYVEPNDILKELLCLK